MKNRSKSPAPEGYSTVSPHLMVVNIEKELEFMQNTFHAEIVEEFKQPDGKVIHATARIGDTTIMLGLATDAFPAITSMNYIFVEDVDGIYRQALKHQATSLMEPADQFFGHRQGGIKDPQGNTWWLAKFLRKVPEEEMKKMFEGQDDQRTK